MTTVSVLVPLSGDHGGRGDVWRWLRRRYEQDHPDWEIVIGVGSHRQWRKGDAVNHAFVRASGAVLVVADADCLVHPGILSSAVCRVLDGTAAWVQPHAVVYRLNRPATADVLAGNVDLEEIPTGRHVTHPAVLGGGVVVLSRDAYKAVGGIDRRFIGWGGDDLAFGWALDTLAGQHYELGAPLWHLWHEPHHLRRRALPEVERLAGRYREAHGHPDLMRALVAGAPDDEAWREAVAGVGSGS